MAKLLSLDQARTAIYFDFEGCVGQAPSILGWSYLRDDGTEHFRQRVVERDLWPTSRSIVPLTMGKQICKKRPLDKAVRRLCEIAEEGDRLLVSWSKHDLNVIKQYVSNASIVERVEGRYRNALPTARQWLKATKPEVVLARGFGGKHTLATYAKILEISIPSEYGVGVTASGIQIMRAALVKYEEFEKTPQKAKEAWSAVLGHNRLDCKVTREIITKAANELNAR